MFYKRMINPDQVPAVVMVPKEAPAGLLEIHHLEKGHPVQVALDRSHENIALRKQTGEVLWER